VTKFLCCSRTDSWSRVGKRSRGFGAVEPEESWWSERNSCWH